MATNNAPKPLPDNGSDGRREALGSTQTRAGELRRAASDRRGATAPTPSPQSTMSPLCVEATTPRSAKRDLWISQPPALRPAFSWIHQVQPLGTSRRWAGVIHRLGRSVESRGVSGFVWKRRNSRELHPRLDAGRAS